MKPNNEFGNDVLYGTPSHLKNNIGLIKTNATNVSTRSFNKKQAINIRIIDAQNSGQANGPSDG